MKIKTLTINNFQGFNETRFGNLTINFNGRNASIYGKNATGKSSIVSANQWLFTGRDSLGHTVGNGFDIMPKDPKTEEIIHYLQPTVIMVLTLDSGLDIELKKVLVEKWKAAEDNQKTFDGYTTNYFLDDADVNKGVYERKVAEILTVDAETYKLLTDPSYFNEVLHWKKRRDLLIDRVGGEADKDAVFAIDPKLKVLEKHLQIKTIDEHKDSLNNQIKKFKEVLAEIPIKIKENMYNMPDLTGIDFDVVKASIDLVKQKVVKLDNSIADTRNGSKLADTARQIAEVDTTVIKIKNEYEIKNLEIIKQAKLDLQEATNQVDDKGYNTTRIKLNITQKESIIKELDTKRERMKNEYAAESKDVFVAPSDTLNCSKCGQKLPDGTNTLLELEKSFNLSKSLTLEAMSSKAKDIIPELNNHKKDLEVLKGSLEKAMLSKRDSEKLLATVSSEYGKAQAKQSDVVLSKEYIAAMESKADLKEQIESLRTNVDQEVDKLVKEKDDLEAQLPGLQSELAKEDTVSNLITRNTELGLEEKEISRKIQGLKKELSVTDDYITTMVSLMSGKIAKYFDLARFKMYNVLTNGNIENCCDCTHDGVTYWSVNYGTRACMGIDICNSFSKYYGFHGVVLMDESGELTDYLVECDSQLIRFYARAEDEKLRIEMEE